MRVDAFFEAILQPWDFSAAKILIEEAGGKVSDSVSNKTTYLLAGENAGSKMQKAQKLNVTILTEKEFNTLMGS